ncbi:pentapeptide repeat-containing protein [Xanthomonas indica]|uniref:Pentapeptide repeat-containing protein n=1 Tax=Xanthomonas indica TaxID=2912242 RepID=A0AAU8I2E6_9XANT|nr:pentapeptide repeat-containing protein [Xanthomonas indica]MCI2260917.1 pentapeptide repeat-containing protein [Xanthomonas indica]
MLKALSGSGKIKQEDCKFTADVAGAAFANQLFVRLVAKQQKFVRVDFRYSTFEAAYLRSCIFDSCDFTGCRFIACNFHGSSFTGCKFEYAIFERTDISSDILSTECPGSENLKLRFARSLRMNYQQLGDATSVNKAIGVELAATEAHLYKSWRSNESYYRKKYSGINRLRQWANWASFKVLDIIWGNGERPLKLLRTVLALFVGIAVVDAIVRRNPAVVTSYLEGLATAPQIFLGIEAPSSYSGWYLSTIALARLILFALFMAIIVKRFNRR